MKYVRFETSTGSQYGILEGDTVKKLKGDLFGEHSQTGETVPLASLTLLTPCEPSKIVAVGKNYTDHIKELNDTVPEVPCLFMMPTTACLKPEGIIRYPDFSKRVDYEGELALVIKKECHNIKKEEVKDYILGYTCLNDVTARDLQQLDGQWTRAKGIDTFAPFGPVISDEIDPDHVDIETRLNGEVKQHANTELFMFDIATLVTFAAQAFTLLPGDVITTGTPAGIGPMQVGDAIEIDIKGIGVLRNVVGK